MNQDNLNKFANFLERAQFVTFNINDPKNCALTKLRDCFIDSNIPLLNPYYEGKKLFDVSWDQIQILFSGAYEVFNKMRSSQGYENYDGTPADLQRVITNIKKMSQIASSHS